LFDNAQIFRQGLAISQALLYNDDEQIMCRNPERQRSGKLHAFFCPGKPADRMIGCSISQMVVLWEAFIMEVLKVSSHSSPNSVAGAIAGVIREKKMVEVQAVGAGAANQAVKAIAIARGYLAPIGVDLICIPAFANIQIDGEDRTAIKLICEER
jgi:stage V sporulation protein S